MTEKTASAVTAMATSVMAFVLATPLLIPLGLVVVAVGCGLCCVVTGAMGALAPVQ